MLTGLRAVSLLTAALALFGTSSAYALPGNPEDPPGREAALACIENARVAFTATPPTIALGASSTLHWSVKLTGCSARDGLRLGNATVGLEGSQTIQPMANQTYTLTMPITGGEGTLGSVNVTVNLPPVVDIQAGSPDWRSLLFQAVGIPNEIVRIAPDVDMDVSNWENVYIGQGVQLLGGAQCLTVSTAAVTTSQSAVVTTAMSPAPASAPTAAPTSAPQTAVATGNTAVTGARLCGGHDAQHLGPRLYTTTFPKPLFKIRCDGGFTGDNVHISGFRLQGPDQLNTPDSDTNLEEAFEIHSCLGTEIDHMDLSGWAGAAIYVIDEADRQSNPADTLKIHDNFIHLNQHTDHNGYGVDVAAGAWALIEHNVFDFNRHAITAFGTPGDGYTANQNLVLKGGGYNGDFFDETVQIFDVHGDDNCDSPTGSSWNCGHAGTEFWITNNAFQYTNDYDFKIRGTPTKGAYVNNNVIVQNDTSDAFDENGTGMGIGGGPLANVTGYDSFGKYGVCDLDGDGKDDLFLPTGAGWWYMSSARMQWTYLNSYTERLNEVALGDFNGDGRCDVFAVHGNEWVVSDGGSSPWRSLGSFGIPFEQLSFGDFNGDGITDIFRRSPDGQWSAISPGLYDWTQLQSSSLPLSQLRFGDFNGDRVTDVVALEGGHWSVSWGGRSAWAPLNSALSDNLSGLLLTDLDHDGAADVLRYQANGPLSGTWLVSWGGRSGWQTLSTMTWPESMRTQRPADSVWGFVGRFSSPAAGELLAIDVTRKSLLYSQASGTFAPYGMFSY